MFHLLRIEFEKVGDALRVCRRRRKAIRLVHERVEVCVGLHQIGRHRERVVEVGQRCVGMRRARELLAVPRDVMDTMRNYTGDPAAVYRWRNAMADLLESPTDTKRATIFKNQD